MRVLILGGAGFLGKRLTKEVLNNACLSQGAVTHLVAMDVSFPPDMPADPRLECVAGDFSDASAIKKALDGKPDLIFHLAAIVSGEAEKDFDRGMKVNFQGSMLLLEFCRKLAIRPRIVFASSCGVFGGDVTKVVEDDTAAKPRSSYGTEKAMVELLINDYSRRSFVDGRTVRLPTIAVRPGKPNAATSSFLSAIIREPLNGKEATYPVPAETKFWIQSPRRVTENFIHAANIDENVLGPDRVINLPGLTVSVKELIDTLEKLTGPQVTRKVVYVPDDFLQSIVLTWPAHFETARANKLGFVRDKSAQEIITAYMEEEGINDYQTEARR